MVTVQAAIEVRAIGQRTRFRGITLRDVSLTVGYGELVAIIGGSGSGKTTLLDVMSGLRPPSSGSVHRELERVGYVPDADTLHAVLPLARALRYTAAIRGVRVGEREIEDALRMAGLAASADVPVGELDPGERKRAAIAAELLARPAFLFLEEPTAALDPAQGAEVMRLLRGRSDGGTTVVLTTHSPRDAVSCDKVAVLAAGGHLAFFGTTEAACGYFGADSLDEICERLAGLGDPAAAWSRRFFHFSQASRGFLVSPTIPPQPGPVNLVPDSAGPHSAGRPDAARWLDDELLDDEPHNDRGPNGRAPGIGLPSDDQRDDDERDDGQRRDDEGDGGERRDDEGDGGRRRDDERDDPRPGAGDHDSPYPPNARYAMDRNGPRGPSRVPRAVDTRGVAARRLRQLGTLVARNTDLLRRDRPGLAVLAAAPLAVLLALAVLLPAGALGPAHASAACMAWAALGVFAAGLAYGLPQVRSETGVLRAERFAGLSSASYVLAKLALLLPVIAAGDALILLVPALSGRLPAGGYGTAFALLLLSSAVALALALLLSAAHRAAFAAAPAITVPAALAIPPLLLAAALLAALVTFARPAWADMLVLAALAAALLVATTVVIARGTSPTPDIRPRHSPPRPSVKA
jgi:ABC-type multidrug transport system ATPase subunit